MARHQQYFEVLGLNEPPADRKAVKRAYSKMLKVTRPEDDPEGFMRLRDAHDQALNIIKWQAEEREWDAKQAANEASSAAPPDTPNAAEDTAEDSSLSYGDMIPEPEPEKAPEPEIDTSYSIGRSPSFDAPVPQNEYVEPPATALIGELNTMLADPKKYNDREYWNVLFRKARQLDIDDYVDFEAELLESILRFHGYFDYHADHDTPQKMPMKFTPSIAASLFKTMSWDQVNKGGFHRGEQIVWLERRMNMRKRGTDPVPIPETKSGGNGQVWVWLIGLFIALKIIQALVNS